MSRKRKRGCESFADGLLNRLVRSSVYPQIMDAGTDITTWIGAGADAVLPNPLPPHAVSVAQPSVEMQG